VNKARGFWDASALLPLCVQEATSAQAQSLLRKFPPVVWWSTSVEVHSAISRLTRLGKLSNKQQQGALARLSLLSEGWREILPDDQLRELAGDLLDKHPLQAADSLQLAAALTWCQQRPSKRNFVSGDQRLCEAARSLGFSIVQLSRISL
jgi:predicted nucleic acid-binding protein